ncbi:MAG: hypothetical protein V1847_04615 [Candidatus Diapherotrites archaeon]
MANFWLFKTPKINSKNIKYFELAHSFYIASFFAFVAGFFAILFIGPALLIFSLVISSVAVFVSAYIAFAKGEALRAPDIRSGFMGGSFLAFVEENTDKGNSAKLKGIVYLVGGIAILLLAMFMFWTLFVFAYI